MPGMWVRTGCILGKVVALLPLRVFPTIGLNSLLFPRAAKRAPQPKEVVAYPNQA